MVNLKLVFLFLSIQFFVIAFPISNLFASELTLDRGLSIGDSGSSEYGRKIIVDSDENIYVLGETTGSLYDSNLGNTDIILSKYDKNMNLLWGYQLGGGGSDYSYGLSLDKENNVYIIGYTDSKEIFGQFNHGTSGTDILLAKINANGSFEWGQLIGTTTTDRGYGIIVHEDLYGNSQIYISGYTKGNLYNLETLPSDNLKAFILKFDLEGNYMEQGILIDNYPISIARDIYIDDSDNIYIIGDSTFSKTIETDGFYKYVSFNFIYTFKLNQDFEVIFEKHLYGSNGTNSGVGIVVDAQTVYITGYFSKSGFDNLPPNRFKPSNIFLTKLDKENGLVNLNLEIGTKTWDVVEGISLDNEANLYLIGESYGALYQKNHGDYDAFVAKYKNDGTFLWGEMIGTEGYEEGNGLYVDSLGEIYIVGESSEELFGENDDSSSRNIFIAKYFQINYSMKK